MMPKDTRRREKSNKTEFSIMLFLILFKGLLFLEEHMLFRRIFKEL